MHVVNDNVVKKFFVFTDSGKLVLEATYDVIRLIVDSHPGTFQREFGLTNANKVARMLQVAERESQRTMGLEEENERLRDGIADLRDEIAEGGHRHERRRPSRPKNNTRGKHGKANQKARRNIPGTS